MQINQHGSFLELENISKTFNTKCVLDGVSLAFTKDTYNAIIGPSGAGKSTLIRCVNGLIQPTSGRVLFNGNAIEKFNTSRSHFAMIYQNYNLIPRLSVLNNVLVGRLSYLHGWKKISGSFSEKDKYIALQSLEKTGIAEYAFTDVRELSGGQRQRVGIARALAQESKIILADEPISSLDPRSAITIIELLKKICIEERITVVVNIHQVELAQKYFDRIIGLKKGRLVYDSIVNGEFSDIHYRTVYEE